MCVTGTLHRTYWSTYHTYHISNTEAEYSGLESRQLLVNIAPSLDTVVRVPILTGMNVCRYRGPHTPTTMHVALRNASRHRFRPKTRKCPSATISPRQGWPYTGEHTRLCCQCLHHIVPGHRHRCRHSSPAVSTSSWRESCLNCLAPLPLPSRDALPLLPMPPSPPPPPLSPPGREVELLL